MSFNELMNNMTFTYIMWGITALFIIAFIVYSFTKEARDEHGRAILGQACFNGILALFVFINILMQYTHTVMQNPIFFTNSIRLMFNGFLLVVFISIAILRKIR